MMGQSDELLEHPNRARRKTPSPVFLIGRRDEKKWTTFQKKKKGKGNEGKKKIITMNKKADIDRQYQVHQCITIHHIRMLPNTSQINKEVFRRWPQNSLGVRS